MCGYFSTPHGQKDSTGCVQANGGGSKWGTSLRQVVSSFSSRTRSFFSRRRRQALICCRAPRKEYGPRPDVVVVVVYTCKREVLLCTCSLAPILPRTGVSLAELSIVCHSDRVKTRGIYFRHNFVFRQRLCIHTTKKRTSLCVCCVWIGEWWRAGQNKIT